MSQRLEKPKAKERLKAAGKAGGQGSGKLPEASVGDTRDKVGESVGMSGKEKGSRRRIHGHLRQITSPEE